MLNPRKINLYLENELPKAQSGGAINVNLINNNTHKYIRTDNKVETFIYGASKIEENVQLWFEFNNEIMNIDSQNENLYYMERTTNSISFNIKELKKYSNVTVKGMPKVNLTLKLIDLTYKNIDVFIEDWKTNKNILGSSIPNSYMYGVLHTKEGQFISNYYITTHYKNHISLLKLDYEYTMKYIIKMLLFIEKCNENNIILRNFKFSGFGYEFIDSEINFVLLDYIDTSLIKKNEEYFKLFADGCDSMCAGTLVPYFIIYDFFEMNSEWITKLDRLYIIGLAESLIFLLYNQDDIMEKLFKLLYEPSYLKPCLHYYHYMKLFDDVKKKKTFFDLLNSLQPKFVEIDLKYINPMFKRIIINCFETKYNTIYSPSTYLNHIKKIYDEYNQLKASIKTYIKPIDTIEETKPVLYIQSKKQELNDDIIKTETFVRNKLKTEKKLLEKSEMFEDSDLHDMEAKFALSQKPFVQQSKSTDVEELETKRPETETDIEEPEEPEPEDNDIKEQKLDKSPILKRKDDTITTDLAELKKFIESDDMIESDDFIPIPPKPLAGGQLKSILKHNNIGEKKYKKVVFIDAL